MFISPIKYSALTLFAACSLACVPAKAQQKAEIKKDSFELICNTNPVDKYSQEDLPRVFRETINPSSWTNDSSVLKNAPSPKFKIMSKNFVARGVVDVENCMFFVYNSAGKPIEAFKIATGKQSTPTDVGIRKVIAKMIYPYSSSPRRSKRRRHPADYGPKIAYLNIVDTVTGDLHDNGEYIHGTRHEKAITGANRHVTHGCVRFHNRDALYIVNDVLKIGDYIKFIK